MTIRNEGNFEIKEHSNRVLFKNYIFYLKKNMKAALDLYEIAQSIFIAVIIFLNRNYPMHVLPF